ncbi:VWA domain-containing protein [Candidatus Thiosymbion oneisti]|uniref:VWA domain-containing protein n=1 Tax=Candidatus Thiosymbion oneisti TaxID=589554 RepID=UPI001060AB79|nr:VWA domain-containing protein [Candidatus Thiosymbion oneisti]
MAIHWLLPWAVAATLGFIWLAPLWPWLRPGAKGGSDWRRAVVILALRGGAIGAVLALYLTGGVWEQAVERRVPAPLEVLVDVSQSLVDPDRGGDMDAYQARIEAFVEALVEEALPTALEPRFHLFAGAGIQVEAETDWAAQIPALGPTSTDLEGILARIAAGGEHDAHPVLLITDGRPALEGRPQATRREAILAAAARSRRPVFVVPVGADPAWWPEATPMPRLSLIDLPRNRRPGEDSRLGISVQAQRPEQGAIGYLHLYAGTIPLLFQSQWSCGLAATPRPGAIILAPDHSGDPILRCRSIKLRPPEREGLIQLTLAITREQQKPRQSLPRFPTGSELVNRFIGLYPPARVLLLDGGDDGPPEFITGLFDSRDWRREVKAPEALQEGVDFMDYDLVVFNDLGPARLTADAERRDALLGRLRDYVRAGGGLVVIGGAETFGHQGYAATPMAELLPVELHPKGSGGGPPMDVVVVLDVSASLYYDQPTFERAIGYLLDSVTTLSAGSRVGVLGYSDEPHELIPLTGFVGRDALKARLDGALERLDREFERWSRIGLAPEGIALYGALESAYRRLDATQSDATQLHTTGARREQDERPEQRVLLIADARDLDPMGLEHWWVDDQGRFRREHTRRLAKHWLDAQGIVLNALGMVRGETSLPPLEQLQNPADEEAADTDAMQRYWSGIPGYKHLLAISEAGGGTAYLDRFQIPFGRLSRRMVDYAEERKRPRLNPSHLFFAGLPDPGPHLPRVSGYAVTPEKAGAETVMSIRHRPQLGPVRDLALWSNWMLVRRPETDETGAVRRGAFGGRVVAFISSFRGLEAETRFVWEGFRTAWRRAMAWTRRDRPRDLIRLQVRKAGPETLQIRAQVDSLDGLDLDSFQVDVQRLRPATPGKVPTDPSTAPEEDPQDGADLEDTALPEPKVYDLGRDAENAWQGRISIPVDADRLKLVLRAEGKREKGDRASIEESAEVIPGLLAPIREPLTLAQGPDSELLEELAELTGGSVIPFQDQPQWPAELAVEDRTLEETDRTDLRWLLMALFAALLLADMLYRRYGLKRELPP